MAPVKSEVEPITEAQAIFEAQEDDQDELHPTKHNQGQLRSALAFLEYWAWEAAGIFVSAALIISIVTVLRKYNGRQQPSWKYISLNSLVAWLSTLSKACLLFAVSNGLGQMKWVWFSRQSRTLSDLDTFDLASRGLSGSVALLWLVKGRHLAAIGSLAMIFSIGFDPFVQNLVHYVPHYREDPSQVSLLASTRGYNTVGPLLGGDTFYVDPILKANVYSALFNLDPTLPWSKPQHTCPTGNCTWDAMASLEIGASCSNITSQLKSTCFESKDASSDFGVPYPNCTLSLKSGVTLWYLPDGGAAQPIVYIFAAGSNQNPTEGGGISTEIGNNTLFIATECVLQPLVQSFKASVNMGVYQEERLEKWTAINRTLDGDYALTLKPDLQENFAMNGTQIFGIGWEAMRAIESFVTDLFNGYVVAGSDHFSFERSGDGVGTYAATDTLEAIFYKNLTNSNCPENDQLTCAIKNVASAMSKTIRDGAFTGNVSYEPLSSSQFTRGTTAGRTMVTITYVAIHWRWLVLPVAVWLLGALSCLCSAWSTHRVHIQTWMSSSLPLAIRPIRSSPNFRGKGYDDVEIDASGRKQTETGVQSYRDLVFYNKSLKDYSQRATRMNVKLEAIGKHDNFC
ncbi:hypothetical protein DTO012A8_7597 [Penicillium roqueforti]|nr:hypothetical protein DTO012A8_7597 [Penicillium roqueforti]KAI3146735.1 hypothetical protein CBS147325_4616 [Penicillium roqueforti]KAI3225039.1 hypothetical protein DTO012A9_9606 [Penicillium roqueforti]